MPSQDDKLGIMQKAKQIVIIILATCYMLVGQSLFAAESCSLISPATIIHGQEGTIAVEKEECCGMSCCAGDSIQKSNCCCAIDPAPGKQDNASVKLSSQETQSKDCLPATLPSRFLALVSQSEPHRPPGEDKLLRAPPAKLYILYRALLN